MYTHYPVPSKVKVSKELVMSTGLQELTSYDLYPMDEGHWHDHKHRKNVSDHIGYINHHI